MCGAVPRISGLALPASWRSSATLNLGTVFLSQSFGHVASFFVRCRPRSRCWHGRCVANQNPLPLSRTKFLSAPAFPRPSFRSFALSQPMRAPPFPVAVRSGCSATPSLERFAKTEWDTCPPPVALVHELRCVPLFYSLGTICSPHNLAFQREMRGQ